MIVVRARTHEWCSSANASYKIKADKAKPTIGAAATASLNAAGWYNGNVTVHVTCSAVLHRREKAEHGHWPTVAPVGFVNNRVTHRIDVDPVRKTTAKAG